MVFNFTEREAFYLKCLIEGVSEENKYYITKEPDEYEKYRYQTTIDVLKPILRKLLSKIDLTRYEEYKKLNAKKLRKIMKMAPEKIKKLREKT